ncbi:MAG: hypothetical protein K2I56_00410 [Muribaculaceae bacterium]|nr:hypothetical protein [Muribaculaceae bacterium]
MKHLYFPLAGATMLLLAACGASPSEKADEQARNLLGQAQSALESKDLDRAQMLLDSLDHGYKEAVGVRREAMPLRARLIEEMSLKQIPQADEAIAQAMMRIDQLGQRMSDAGDKVDPYVVPKAWPKRGDIKAEGIEPRVDRDGFFRLIVKSSGKTLDMNAVEFSAEGSSVTSKALPSDRVAKVEGMELMSLSQEEFAPVAEWLEAHSGSVPTVELVGLSGRRKITFSAAQAAMLLDAWRYSRACQELVSAKVERERLERQLKIARDQSARVSEADSTGSAD